MRNIRKSAMPILAEPPSVISFYIRLVWLSLLIGVLAVIAGVVGSLLNDHFVNLYRKWLYYLK
jgi:hypothetical protein